MNDKDADTDERARLTAEQYAVTRERATEAPFSGEYLHNQRSGEYRCICCGNALFSSQTKYDSGSGWPSFWAPLAKDRVKEQLDTGHGMRREEILCAHCDAHLGHVFDDGPDPSGRRFCVNSAALDFRAREESED